MKISKETLTILHSFSNISVNLYVEKGNVIKIKPIDNDSIVAKAIVEDEFEESICIGNLPTFLQLFKLFEDPELDVQPDLITFKEKGRKATYRQTKKSLINIPSYEKDHKLPTVDVSFKLEESALSSVLRGTTVLSQNNICFTGDGKDVIFSSFDSLNSSNNKEHSDSFSIKVGETDENFRMVFNTNLFNMIKKDYDVELSFKGISKFSSDNLIYWVAPVKKGSYYNGE
jgi:hypothetical protein